MKGELKNLNWVIVPTDKTGSFVSIETNLYVEKMKTHLVKAAKEIGREKLIEI